MSDRVNIAYRSRPDPKEPWRYVTPCCKALPHQAVSMVSYKCTECGKLYNEDELIDRRYKRD